MTQWLPLLVRTTSFNSYDAHSTLWHDMTVAKLYSSFPQLYGTRIRHCSIVSVQIQVWLEGKRESGRSDEPGLEVVKGLSNLFSFSFSFKRRSAENTKALHVERSRFNILRCTLFRIDGVVRCAGGVEGLERVVWSLVSYHVDHLKSSFPWSDFKQNKALKAIQ